MRPSAVMHKAGYWCDPQFGKALEPGIVPIPIGAFQMVRCDLFPQDGVP